MAAKPLYQYTPAAVADAIQRAGSVAGAARLLGMPRQTLQSMRDRFAREATSPAVAPPAREPEADRLRAQVRQLKAQLAEREQLALSAAEVRSQIFGLAAAPRGDVAWKLPPAQAGRKAAEMPIAIWSDWHYGETVRSPEVSGCNAYNCAEADKRVQALVKHTLDLCLNHMSNPNYPAMVVCLAGDFVTGEIHDELTQSNDGDLLPAVLRVVDILVWAFGELLRSFPRIYVPCVSGNHGRNTAKIQHKRFIFKNFDWLIYTLLERHFKDEPRITFDNRESNQVRFDVCGKVYMLLHGHDLGVKGGDALIGISGPVIRGRLKAGLSEQSLGSGFDYLLLGHFHTYMPLLHSNGVLVNGSLIGYTEYSRDRRYRYQRPVQSLHFHHPRHGITAMWPVYVSEDGASDDTRETIV